jgi:sulfate-transporting ATPase
MNKQILVETAALKHTYHVGKVSTEVLHGIDLTIKSGNIVFLTGYSGSGKTTLVSLIGCLRSVQQGSLKLLGEELNGASEAKLRQMRRSIGYVFQHFNLLDFMTLRQNVQQSLKLQNNYSAKKACYLAEEMLDKVGLGHRVNAYPGELSGGQKQRVAIARALVHKPQLVIADEPTAALDSVTGREVIEIFQNLVKQQNSAALIVTHNTRVLDSADEILQMEDGHLGTAAREQLSLALPTLKDLELEQIAKFSDLKVYSPGETIIQQGDIATEFFILIKGMVEIVHIQDGQEVHIAQIRRRGDYFGEMGLLHENTIRTATVRAVGTENVEVLAISREVFLKMVGDSKQTQAIIKSEMLQRIHENMARTTDN